MKNPPSVCEREKMNGTSLGIFIVFFFFEKKKSFVSTQRNAVLLFFFGQGRKRNKDFENTKPSYD